LSDLPSFPTRRSSDLNQGTAGITVVRTGDTSDTDRVDFVTRDESAVAGVNYTAAGGTLTFGPGVTSATFNVTLIDDGKLAGNKRSEEHTSELHSLTKL